MKVNWIGVIYDNPTQDRKKSDHIWTFEGAIFQAWKVWMFKNENQIQLHRLPKVFPLDIHQSLDKGKRWLPQILNCNPSVSNLSRHALLHVFLIEVAYFLVLISLVQRDKDMYNLRCLPGQCNLPFLTPLVIINI